MKSFTHNRQRGFTLIEMLIALMIGSIVAISLTLITRSMAQTAQNEQMIVEASQSARAGIDMLRLDFMRTGMFYAANPRADANPNSLVSSGSGGLAHHAYFRSPIVHLHPGADGMDSVILVGNFIGDTMYEGDVDVETNTITLTTPFEQGRCAREFDGNYAFAHLVNATGQTHEVKVSSVTPPLESACSSNICTQCVVTIEPGELIEGAFGERNVKVGANQALLFRVETLEGNRNVLMKYLIDYDGANADTLATGIAPAITAVSALNAVVVAENVVDFQVWFRSVDTTTIGAATPVADQTFYPSLSGSAVETLPSEKNVLVNQDDPLDVHLPFPSSGNIAKNDMVFPEHVRSAIISLAVRTEKTDQQQQTGSSPGTLVSDELASAPVDTDGTTPLDVGNYKVRRYTVEVKLPNIQSQMALFQAPASLSY